MVTATLVSAVLFVAAVGVLDYLAPYSSCYLMSMFACVWHPFGGIDVVRPSFVVLVVIVFCSSNILFITCIKKGDKQAPDDCFDRAYLVIRGPSRMSAQD